MSETKEPFRKKYLTCPGLKPSDYYLYQQAMEQFNFKMRDVFVLGLRMIYACAGGQITREQMLQFVVDLANENLDYENRESRPVYKTLAERLNS